MYESVEGRIRAREAEAVEAEKRLDELLDNGIGPGRYAGESIAARGPERNYNALERALNNASGAKWGCNTCGTFDPGTLSGNWVFDHQMPTAWNPLARSQRLYPQCLACSSRQGNWIMRHGGRR